MAQWTLGTVGVACALLVAAPALAAPTQAAPAAQAKPAPVVQARPADAATQAPAVASAAKAGPIAVVSLPLDLKDPYTAYGLGTIPFMSNLAASYVGSTRLAWRPNEALAGAATNQGLADWGMLVGGLGLLGLAQGLPYELRGQGLFVGVAALAGIPLAHGLIYGPWWGDQAVEANRRELARHGFPLDAPAPLILAPAAN